MLLPGSPFSRLVAVTPAPLVGTTRVRSGRLDCAAARCDGVPGRAEVVQAFSVGLARLGVADERVERVTCVCHLPLAVGPPGHAEQGGAYAAPRPSLRGAEQRRPVGRAGGVAGTPAALVLLEQIERAAACVDENLAERRLA